MNCAIYIAGGKLIMEETLITLGFLLLIKDL